MFEGLVASVINKFLGDYVANLETKQLSIGIWQGDVVLHNLRLKREALDKFNLPVDVLEGYLGDLTISIPWNDLKNKPVKVFINNVYLLAKPKADSDYDPILEEDRAHRVKLEKLETADMLSAKDKLPGADNKQNASFVAQLVTKIVDNLQFTIKNIHIRYEDKVNRLSSKPLAVGITLSELSAVSTDENWNEAFIHEEVGLIHKLVRLGSLAIYWNTDTTSLAGLPQAESLEIFMSQIASEDYRPPEHQYILKPVSGQGKLTLSKTFKEGQPRNHASVEFDEFGFILDDEQYLSIFSLMGSFSSFVRSQQFRKYRPPRTITPLIDPRAWFKYAGTCILSEIHERNAKWTWAYFAERRDDRILYIKLHKLSKAEGATISPENTELLRQLERKLSYNDIRFYRSIAKNQLKKEKASIVVAPQPEQKTTIGWISDWWSGAPAPTGSREAERSSSLTDVQVQQLMETIEYDPQSALDESDLPKELKFEHKPLDERADEAIYLSMLPLQVIYNPAAVSAIIDFFTPPASELDTMSTLRTVAQDTLQGLTAQTRAGIEFAIGSHRTVDIKVDMAAPIFVFPESCTVTDSMVVVIDAGHLLVESNLVDKEVKKELERKQGSELTESDLAKLESLLYDRFTCSLTSVQAIVGRSVETCLKHVKMTGESDLHLLERVDVTFQLEMCILPKLAKYARMAVTGNLPRLHINLSDRKYKTMMRILDIVTGKNNARRPVIQPNAGKGLDWTFPSGSSTDLVLDESDDSFFDAEENLSMNVIEKPADSPDRILFKFGFEVGQISASLKRSQKGIDAAEQSLANLKISGFDLRFRQRPFDMNVRIRIRSVSIENEATFGASRPQYLIAPSSLESLDDLLLIDYTSVNRASPAFNGTDQTVDISFASLDVLLVKDSILGLYDFILITFTGNALQKPPSISDEQKEEAAGTIQEIKPVVSNNVMVVRAKMNSINFVIIQNDVSIATLSFAAGQMSITLNEHGNSIAGRLGNLSIVDNIERVGSKRLFKQFLRIDGSEVADFTLDTYNKTSPKYPGYDSSLRLRTSSVKMTFIEPLIVELLAFFKEFSKLHFLLESARRAAAGTQETAGKFHFDLHLETPVIEFPDTSLVSTDVLSMYLGRISARNDFSSDIHGEKNDITADIKELKLVSSLADSKESKLMEDVSIETKITFRSSPDGEDIASLKSSADLEHLPGTLITSELNEIIMKLNQRQYGFILEVLNSVSRALSGGQPPEESGEDSEDDLTLTYSRTSEDGSSTDLAVKIPSISLEIEKEDKSTGEPGSLAVFSVLSLLIRAATFPDSSMEAQLHAHSLRIADSRPKAGNLFREIMPEIPANKDQVSIKYSKSSSGITNTLMLLDSLRLLLVIDHLFEIRNFFLISSDVAAQGEASSPAAPAYHMAEQDSKKANQMRINMVSVEMILLHNALAEDTEAIILSASEIAYSSSVISTLSISEMGMFFCVMTKREETTLRFIQNFNLTLVLDNRLTGPGHRLTNIYIDVSPLMLRVSYRDVSLITDVFNKVMELGKTYDIKPQPVEPEINSSTILVQEDIVMSREKIHVTTRGIRVLLIDDLNDVHLPMFNVAVDKLILEISDWSSTLRIDTGIKLHANYFNIKNSHWEPLVELFEVYLNVSRQEDAKMCIDVYVRKKLELNLSHVFVETSLNAMSLISKQNRVYVPRSNAHSPYILRNKTGYNMHVWAESLGDGLDTEVFELKNDAEIPWRFDDWRAMRESLSPSPNKLSIMIDNRGWEPLKGISVDREGVKTYILREDVKSMLREEDDEGKRRKRGERVAHRLVCEVRLKSNRKIVTFRSSTVVYNSTSIPVDVMVLSVNSQKQYRIFTLGPDEECPIPIESAYRDKILIRPQDFKPNEPAFLSNGEDYRDEILKLFDAEGLQLNLGIKYSDKLEFGGRKVTIYSPYVLLNKTSLDAVYSARSIMASNRLAAGQSKAATKPLSFEAVGSSFDVVIPSPSRNQELHVGVTVKEGDGKYFLSKIVTFTPRFIVKNNMSEDVFCRQNPSAPTTLVKSGDYIPVLYFSELEQRQLSLRLSGLMDEWSSPFTINQIGQMFVKLSRMGSKSEELLRAEVMLEGATVFIVVSKEEGRWPFRVDNFSEVNIEFWQKTSAARYRVNPNEQKSYAWDNPLAAEKSLILEVEGREREVDIRGIGQLEPLKYQSPGDPTRIGVISIRVYAEGPTLVVSLGPYIESKIQRRQTKLLNSRRPSTETASIKGKEPETSSSESVNVVDATNNMVLQVRLEGIGISLISRDVKEILYASAKKVDFIYKDSPTTQDISFRIGWLQIDNQLAGAFEPIFVYPTVLPKEGEELYHLMAALSKSKDTSYGVDYYNIFTILLQEISVDLDEDFLYALINFAKFDISGWEQKESNFFDMDLSIPKSKFADGDTRMYFEKFLVQPMQFNISFQRTHTERLEEARGVSSNILTFFFDVFTMTVGNIHLHKVIGSADFLGNPVGLFNNVSSGVRDFFYKPIEGFEISRPQDFGIGLAKGTTSLFKKTVYGVSDTLSKFAGSVSKGLAVITLDEEFQESRRLQNVRNRPRHAGQGVTTGASSLVSGVVSGISGVLSKPIEGAEKEGVGGFFKGVGKGLVGFVSKPLIGVFDLATNVSEGIKNTTTVFDKELEKIRLPRHIGKEGILTPYDSHEAQGSHWLRSINSGANEDYFAHLELNIEDLVVIVTDLRILMVRWRSNKIDWEILYKDLQLAQINNGGITLIQRGAQQAKARIIPCSNRNSAQWIHNRIEIMLARSSSTNEIG
ncbi:hypothetical protein HDU97_005982 [Phlyctochytrium planicorne]|nr:hypothetical protein HDU97_005982 [Phlyctochytrium planicorne]